MAIIKRLYDRCARVKITLVEVSGRGWILPYRYGHNASEGGRREKERGEQIEGS